MSNQLVFLIEDQLSRNSADNKKDSRYLIVVITATTLSLEYIILRVS